MPAGRLLVVATPGGARSAANSGASTLSGERLAARLLADSLSAEVVRGCEGDERLRIDRVPVVEIRCRLRVPMTVFPFLPDQQLTVRGRAVKEPE